MAYHQHQASPVKQFGCWPLMPLMLLVWLVLGACATKPVEPYVFPAPEHAMPVKPDGAFSQIEGGIRNAHGPDVSGFQLLDRNEDGLCWRLALIDSAKYSIDVQYYTWFGDAVGNLLAKRLLDAADRGVKVRMLVDDLNTAIRDAETVALRDDAAAWVDAHPNLEIRLFNPWTHRTLAGRVGEMVSQMERVNHRMHNKAMIVDNQAVILGGRNIGDEYMGLHSKFNFHDLDVLGIGPVARQTSDVFDRYWNSDWVIPVSAIAPPPPVDVQQAARDQLIKRLSAMPSLEHYPISPQSWSAEILALTGALHVGVSRVHSDVPTGGVIRQEMREVLYGLATSARRELLIINAYIIPDDRFITELQSLNENGVEIQMLTNSLASHDVPAVNSHYKKWRRPLLEARVHLFELRHDAAIQPLVVDTPPTHSEFVGLHAKAMVVDRQRVYIGSMNFDPRSATINTEMGAIIESPGLADALAKQIERDVQGANSWHVELDDDGDLRWVNDQEIVTSQPARNWWQRVQDVMFMLFPREYY